MSWYLTVRSDEGYSEFTDTALLTEFLSGLPELQQTGVMVFGSAEPWVSVHLLLCNSRGGYSHMHSDPPFALKVNLVELVCGYTADPEWCERLASRIAGFLDWEAVEDLEERRLYPPS